MREQQYFWICCEIKFKSFHVWIEGTTIILILLDETRTYCCVINHMKVKTLSYDVEWWRSSENFEAKAKCLLVQIFTKCELVQMFTKCVRVSSENFEAKCELVKIFTQLNFYPCPTSWLPPYYCCLCPTKLQIMHVFFTKLCAHRSLKCGYV